MTDPFDFAPFKLITPPKVEDIPRDWKVILDYIRSVAPEALLAGGALRDLAQGVPHADLDIFVYAEGNDAACGLERKISHVLGAVPEKFVGEFDTEKYRKHFGQTFVGLSEYEVLGECVQVVYLDLASYEPEHMHITTPFEQALFDRIDFGACQIAFDGAKIHTTSFCRADLENGMFT
ncbi:MAG: hypothetical protein AAF368_08155, partial [Planctomycetota bacterium]